jgi:hypothetical protein
MEDEIRRRMLAVGNRLESRVVKVVEVCSFEIWWVGETR